MVSWSEDEKAITVEFILRPDGFFDHVVAMWFARADNYEERIYVEHALKTDDVLRREIATW